MIIFQSIEFMACFIEALLGILVNAKTLSGERLKSKDNIIASFAIAFFIWFINQFWIFSVIVTIFGIIGIVISSKIIYKTKSFDSIALTILYLLLVYIIDFLSMALFGLAIKNTQFASVVTTELSYARMCYLILDKTFLIVVYLILKNKCLAKTEIPILKFGIGVILVGVQVAILVENTYKHIDTETFYLWLFLLFLVLTIIYLAIQVMIYVKNNDRMVMALERNDLLADNYKKTIENYKKDQIFYHDLKNQFVVIKNYLKNEDFYKAEEYVEQLSFVEIFTLQQRTGIDVLDILIEYKKKEAEAKKIHMDIITNPINLKLAESEIVALFGNLLDNAIEACNKIEDDIKWIRVVIRRKQNMTFIKISNSYGESPIYNENNLKSLKKYKRMHGLGVTSMKIIVEKYDGNIDIDYNSEKFTVMISFFN